MKITRAVVPSLFTVLNMFSGFMAIIHASRAEFVPAAWFIILAAGFDAMDGIMARITKSSSEFGVEIDSLSDVISFGAAPAFLVYQMHLNSLGGVGILLSSMPMVFAGLRLARFNVQLVGFDKDHFVGLPVPVSAITIASLAISAWSEPSGLDPLAASALPWLAAGLALLMVSKIRYDSLPRISRRAVRREPWKFVFLVLAGIVVVVTAGKAMFPLMLMYIALGMVRGGFGLLRRLGGAAEKEDEAVEPTRIDT